MQFHNWYKGDNAHQNWKYSQLYILGNAVYVQSIKGDLISLSGTQEKGKQVSFAKKKIEEPLFVHIN